MTAFDEETTIVPRRPQPLDGGDSSPYSLSDCIPLPADGPLSRITTDLLPAWRHAADRLMFPGMWMVIACVSSVDTYLTIRFREHLLYEELNPLARFLLQADNWEPSLLIGAKFLGSILVLGFLTMLYSRNRRLGLIVTGALTGFQLCLLAYLMLR